MFLYFVYENTILVKDFFCSKIFKSDSGGRLGDVEAFFGDYHFFFFNRIIEKTDILFNF